MLSQSQQNTYQMIAQGDVAAAKRYEAFCLGQTIDVEPIQTKEKYRICKLCGEKYYKHHKKTDADFAKRKFCTSRCFGLYNKNNS